MIRSIVVCVLGGLVRDLAIRGFPGTPLLPFSFQAFPGDILGFVVALAKVSCQKKTEDRDGKNKDNNGEDLRRKRVSLGSDQAQREMVETYDDKDIVLAVNGTLLWNVHDEAGRRNENQISKESRKHKKRLRHIISGWSGRNSSFSNAYS